MGYCSRHKPGPGDAFIHIIPDQILSKLLRDISLALKGLDWSSNGCLSIFDKKDQAIQMEKKAVFGAVSVPNEHIAGFSLLWLTNSVVGPCFLLVLLLLGLMTSFYTLYFTSCLFCESLYSDDCGPLQLVLPFFSRLIILCPGLIQSLQACGLK